MSQIGSPHDRFFRLSMSNPKVAKAFFETHLPAKLKEIVALDTLQSRNGSFVDEHLELAVTDMLYSVRIAGQEGYLYLLAEHQSTPDRWMAFRLIKYGIRIMEQHLNETRSKYLPIVYPLVFYNGKGPYTYSTDVIDLFDNPDLARALLFKPFQLVDVSQIPDESLKQNVSLAVLQLCMKHIFARDLLPYMKELIQSLRAVGEGGNGSYVKAALTYLVEAGEVSNQETFVEMIKLGLSPEAGDTVMTIAQQFEAIGIEKGKVEGKAEGEARAQRLIALRMAKQGLPLTTISQLTELPLREIEELVKSH